MFVQFKVGNFLSFKDVVTFSLLGYAPVKEHENKQDASNVFYDPTEKNKLLKSSVIYGANGSGKSNLLSAIGFLKKFVLTSSNESQATDEINVNRFLLSSETDDKPSYFEIIFYLENTRYRFGFETDREKIHSEWLFSLKNEPSAKEISLFTREFQQIKPNNRFFKEGKGLENKTRQNALFLSTVAQLNGEIATNILTWLKSNINVISGLEDNTTSYTISKFEKDDDFRKIVIEFFKSINIGFDDIEIVEGAELLQKSLKNTSSELEDDMKQFISILEKLQEKSRNSDSNVEVKQISTLHKKFDSSQKFIKYENLDFGFESKGTRKLFSLLGPIFDSIQKGKILIVDELDSRLHTLLTMELIKFFHSNSNKQAQLIFASHDTNLLRKEIFRRDQIWFTEKDEIGATDLYSLVEYKVNQTTVRNDATFEKDYLLGKYGAIPFLGGIQNFINDFLYDQDEQEKE